MGLPVDNEYKEDIFQHMKLKENETSVDADMMDLQPEIEWYMRPYLLDFLIDSHYSLKLCPETLFRAITLIDSYCSLRVVFKKHYQLVGCTALWMASKFEDRKSKTPTIKDLRSLCCGAYEEDMFIQMENHILSTLNWKVALPTTESFLSLYEETQHPAHLHIARYLCENALFHRVFIGVSPSDLSQCAYALSGYILYNHLNTYALTSQQVQLVNLLMQHLQTPSRSLAKKYSKNSYAQTSHIIQAFLQQQQSINNNNNYFPPTPPPRTCSSANSTASSIESIPSLTSSPASVFTTPQPQSPASVNGEFPSKSQQQQQRPYMSPPYTPIDGIMPPPPVPPQFTQPKHFNHHIPQRPSSFVYPA